LRFTHTTTKEYIMSNLKTNKATPDERSKFQALIESAKEKDFESDFVYMDCDDLNEYEDDGKTLKVQGRLKLYSMNMADTDVARDISIKYDAKLWICVLMASAKTEDGGYVFEGEDAVKFIESKGAMWYNSYGYKCLELSGYLQEFIASKK